MADVTAIEKCCKSLQPLAIGFGCCQSDQFTVRQATHVDINHEHLQTLGDRSSYGHESWITTSHNALGSIFWNHFKKGRIGSPSLSLYSTSLGGKELWTWPSCHPAALAARWIGWSLAAGEAKRGSGLYNCWRNWDLAGEKWMDSLAKPWVYEVVQTKSFQMFLFLVSDGSIWIEYFLKTTFCSLRCFFCVGFTMTPGAAMQISIALELP